MLPQYDIRLVLISICVASLASFVALDLASRITAQRGTAARMWLAGGALSMGTGIWSMHFIGMLAVRLPIALSYEWITTLLSLVIAVMVSYFALYIVSQPTLNRPRLIVSGITMGLGIVAMHYVGMAALVLDPPIIYDPALVAASVGIAVGASVAALWIAFQLRGETPNARLAKVVSGVIMGTAIYGMHYTAMAAAKFAPNAICTSGGFVGTPFLAGAVTVITVLFLFVTLLLSLIDARMAIKTAAMSASLDTAKEVNRAKDEFLAMLAHELRNPLAAISNGIYLLDNSEPGDTTWRAARDVIARQSTQLTRLIDDLLDVGRLTSGKVTLDLVPLDLNEAVSEALASIRASGKAARHELGYSGASAWIRGDRARIEQIIVNLVVNALNYTPKGGRVHVSVARDGADAVLMVQDTGIGISPDVAPRVFDLFFQADGNRSTGGMGIGLTLVQRLVEVHGGQVRAVSEGLGKGALFMVRLPAVAPVTGQEETGARPAQKSPGCSVVIVEDDADALRTLRMALEMEGHSVATAADGLKGLQLIEETAPEVAVIDIGLPGMDGYELAQRVRNRTPDIYMIALTGYGTAEDQGRARTAGFDAHLIKPADIAKLSQLIKQVRPAPAPTL